MPSPTQDTLAVLLLCAKLGQGEAQAAAKPLTTRQYSALEKWLQERSLHLRDLLQPNGRAQLSELQLHEVAPDQIEILLDRGAALGLLVERWTNSGIWIVGRDDQPYPSRYKNYLLHKAPPIIYGVGEQSSLQCGGLAVVGSRHASEEETGFAQRISAACADQKIAVISGAAKGIDSESMMAAINQGGTAIGVLADGLGRAAIAAPYHEAILDGRLTLISPYEPESRWFSFTAMERNKLIYALADAALVVASSDEQGGTWTGAIEALKHGRIPIYVKASGEIPLGNRKLIQSGALEFLQEPWSNLRQLFENPSPGSLSFDKPGRALPDTSTDVSGSSPSAPEVMKSVETPVVLEMPATQDRDGNDVEERIVCAIFEVLAEPMNERSIARKLNVPLAKTRAGLKRAIQEGKIHKTKTPVQYVRASTALPLFVNDLDLPSIKRS